MVTSGEIRQQFELLTSACAWCTGVASYVQLGILIGTYCTAVLCVGSVCAFLLLLLIVCVSACADPFSYACVSDVCVYGRTIMLGIWIVLSHIVMQSRGDVYILLKNGIPDYMCVRLATNIVNLVSGCDSIFQSEMRYM